MQGWRIRLAKTSPTRDARISPAGEFFVSRLLSEQADQKSRLSRRRERRDPRCLRLPPSSLRHLWERPKTQTKTDETLSAGPPDCGLSPSSTAKVIPQF